MSFPDTSLAGRPPSGKPSGLVLIGIDEAGFGPMLGPLCVGCSVWHIADWTAGDPAPDLWSMMDRAVARTRKDAGDRFTVADSKKLKGSSKKTHPLIHLERGVLAMLGARGMADTVGSDADLLSQLATHWPGSGVASKSAPALADKPPVAHKLAQEQADEHALPWYLGVPTALPIACDPDQLRLDVSITRSAMARAGISLLQCRCEIIGEQEFNHIVSPSVGPRGSKAHTTLAAIGRMLRDLLSPTNGPADGPANGSVSAVLAANPAHLRVVCDRLGGRQAYSAAIERILPDFSASPLIETPELSRYTLTSSETATHIPETNFPETNFPETKISFQTESETVHLPVALASMIAKYVRELAMHRFNEHWHAQMPELKPTAGYVTDARRWLIDASGVLDAELREQMIRKA